VGQAAMSSLMVRGCYFSLSLLGEKGIFFANIALGMEIYGESNKLGKPIASSIYL
jgi:hypothetical protein